MGQSRGILSRQIGKELPAKDYPRKEHRASFLRYYDGQEGAV